MKKSPTDQLTTEEVQTLLAYADCHKRGWRGKLLSAWWNGTDANFPNGHLLRRIRNNLGPTWLASVPADPAKW